MALSLRHAYIGILLFLAAAVGALLYLFFTTSESLEDKNKQLSIIARTNQLAAKRNAMLGQYVQQFNPTIAPQDGMIFSISIQAGENRTEKTAEGIVLSSMDIMGVVSGRACLLAQGVLITEDKDNNWIIPDASGVSLKLSFDDTKKTLTISYLPGTGTSEPMSPLILYKLNIQKPQHLIQGVYRTSPSDETGQLLVGYDFQTESITVVAHFNPSPLPQIYGTVVESGEILVDNVKFTFTPIVNGNAKIYEIPYITGLDTVASGVLQWDPANFTIIRKQLSPAGVAPIKFTAALDVTTIQKLSIFV